MTTPTSPWTDYLGRASVRSGQALLVLALFVVSIFGITQLKLVFIPMLLALIIASALRPFVRLLLARGANETAAATIALICGVGVFGGIVTLVVFGIRGEWANLFTSASEGLDHLQELLTSGALPIDAAQLDDVRESVITFATSSQFGTGALAGVSVAAEIVTGLVLGLVVLFYFLKDGPRIWSFLIQPLSGSRHERAVRIGESSVGVFGSYVRGTAIVAFVDALFIGIGLWILQVPLALPLAVIVFLGAFIPIVGATAAGILAALVALVTNDLTTAIIVVAIVVAVNQLEGNFLSPVVLGKSLRLHGLVILLALTAGTILGGIVGAVISVPIAAVGWAVIKAWNAPVPPAVSEAVEPTQPVGPATLTPVVN
ncbi:MULTISPECIES: AI-2E family transporter [Cryobacterium]|uniref:AI-2E family transporter n=1 Tax=Cryobacterium breve TaxID=1259258 RepID=A0ABY2JBF1_9MICO|nr:MULTISPECIES: AI-2E family transporter [Cryobacterium]TFC91144.1 AI-2E family transporter [Cryobacterium sp. TmT3-12]TFD01161.1 AI-2E family transporter [Cryobacterium breve]